MKGLPAPDDLSGACERLQSWPRCCNGCKRKRAYGCNLKPHVFYDARLAQARADADLRDSRSGIDEDELSAQAKLEAIRNGVQHGLSPEQIAAIHPELDLSVSTIYRWIDLGYAGMTNLDLRRKVGYKPRKRQTSVSQPKNPRRAYAAFLKLDEDLQASAWEMDTVVGAKADNVRLLTLLHRPTRFQLALPIADGTCTEVMRALSLISSVLGGPVDMHRVFGLVITDNGSEFSDDKGIASILGETPKDICLFYCEPRRADQKGACEKNHVEIRKLLPKNKGIRFDRLTRADCSILMSQVNSEPRGCLGFRSPIDAWRSVFKKDAQTLLDAFGIEELPTSKLNLTPRCIEQARKERGDAPLAN